MAKQFERSSGRAVERCDVRYLVSGFWFLVSGFNRKKKNNKSLGSLHYIINSERMEDGRLTEK